MSKLFIRRIDRVSVQASVDLVQHQLYHLFLLISEFVPQSIAGFDVTEKGADLSIVRG